MVAPVGAFCYIDRLKSFSMPLKFWSRSTQGAPRIQTFMPHRGSDPTEYRRKYLAANPEQRERNAKLGYARRGAIQELVRRYPEEYKKFRAGRPRNEAVKLLIDLHSEEYQTILKVEKAREGLRSRGG